MFKEKLIAVLYFFFNSLGLPAGLTLTSVLTPVFAIHLLAKGYAKYVLAIVGIWLVFVVAHMQNTQMEWDVYLRSSLLLFTVYIFGVTVFHFSKNRAAVESVFRLIIRSVFFATLLAIAIYFTPLRDWAWRTENISSGLENFSRLIMFTYEASYFSMLLVPLWFYALWGWIAQRNRKSAIQMLMVLLPLLLSFSLGVLSCIILATVLCFATTFRAVLQNRVAVRIIGIALLSGMLVMVTENPLHTRIDNVLAGDDHSGKNRTVVPYALAEKLNSLEDPWWGIGFGQLKLRGDFIIREAWPEWPIDQPVRLPNVLAESWVSIGYVGIGLRFLLQIMLFIYLRVYRNYFQLSIFFFIFIYQFQGSFMTNMAEATLWALASSATLKAFDRNSLTLFKSDARKTLLGPVPAA